MRALHAKELGQLLLEFFAFFAEREPEIELLPTPASTSSSVKTRPHKAPEFHRGRMQPPHGGLLAAMDAARIFAGQAKNFRAQLFRCVHGLAQFNADFAASA